jgi:hypothetical protein
VIQGGVLISESKIRRAFSELSFSKLKLELSSISTEADLEAFMQLLIRSSELFFKYPNAKKEKLRDDFFADAKQYFVENYGKESNHQFAEITAVLNRTESGYRRILFSLNESPFRKMTPEAQCSAAIELAIDRLRFVHTRLFSSIDRSRNRYVTSSDFEGILEDGTKFSIDAVAAGFVSNLATTLMMFAIENKWMIADGTVLFPTLPTCTKDQLKWAEENELLATSWRRWERVEQRRRYWGGKFVEIDEGKDHSDLPRGSRLFFEYIPSEADRLDCVANERLKDSAFQAVTSLAFESFADKKIVGTTETAKLAPEQYVSFDEIYFAAFLSAVLGVDVRDDATRYQGLRIVEWLRGYCALSEFALSVAGPGCPAKQFLIRFASSELEEKLMKVGLSDEAVAKFVSAVTFSSRNFDLFDCPLLKFRDGSTVLFVPSAIYANGSAVAYSNLISFGETFEKKGKRFEQQVLTFFREKGFKPFSINTVREGEPYEIDVILPWGSYLFVFECKNKALSDNHPIRSYYFAKERDDFVKQIKRQVDGLSRHPDMAINAGGIDPSEKIIVPAILYELPYAEIGQRNGVYISDWYSLSRFFSDRYISFRKSYDLLKKHKLTHRTAIYSFWRGEQPSPEDLLRQLNEPIQIRAIFESLTQIDSVFAIGKDAFGLTKEWYRKSQTLSEIARIFGFDAQEAKDDSRRMKKQVEFWNRRLERGRLIAQERAFREKRKRTLD